MDKKILIIFIFSVVVVIPTQSADDLLGDDLQEEAREFINKYNKEISRIIVETNRARWLFNTNMTAQHEKKFNALQLHLSNRSSVLREEARLLFKDVSVIQNKTIQRQMKLLLLSSTARNSKVRERLNEVQSQIKNIYSNAHVKFDARYIKTFDANMTILNVNQVAHIFATSTKHEELKYCWDEWRSSIGPKVRPLFTEMVQLLNQGAMDNGYQSEADYRQTVYEVDNLQEIVLNFWQGLKPIYEELHAYVRFRLSETYPDLIDPRKGIPAHLLGNLWTTDWQGLLVRVKPYPDEVEINVTPKLLQRNYKVTDMVKIAERFFTSLGWPELPERFWSESVFVKPNQEGFRMVCQPGAYDIGTKFNGTEDVRMAMCGEVNEYYFNTIHHELGHVYYFKFYEDVPLQFREGANPGFHEAIGDTLMLSAKTPLYLKSMALIDEVSNSTASDVNFLMASALRAIAFLPYGALVDLWRWDVFKGKIKPDEYNQKWWEARLKYQGILPPGEIEEDGLDPAAKFHIAWDVPYIRYFFATILQFSFYEQGCKDAGYEGPLHLCSLENSKLAGKRIRKMMELGKSENWSTILEEYTGSEEISAEPLIKYFEPLVRWLKEERRSKKYSIGWDENLPSSYGKSLKPNSLLLLTVLVLSAVKMGWDFKI